MRGELEQCKKEFERYLDYMDSVRQAFPDDAIKILNNAKYCISSGIKVLGQKKSIEEVKADRDLCILLIRTEQKFNDLKKAAGDSPRRVIFNILEDSI